MTTSYTEQIYIERPTYNKTIKGKRALVRFWRSCSAYDMAKLINPDGDRVTEAEYEKAFKLLDRIQRYALADVREFERANSNENYYNSRTHKENEKRLNARREKLQHELSFYGLRMRNYGLYPTICSLNNEEGREFNFLHWFD